MRIYTVRECIRLRPVLGTRYFAAYAFATSPRDAAKDAKTDQVPHQAYFAATAPQKK